MNELSRSLTDLPTELSLPGLVGECRTFATWDAAGDSPACNRSRRAAPAPWVRLPPRAGTRGTVSRAWPLLAMAPPLVSAGP